MCDHSEREAAMVVVRRDYTGRPTVWCDPCLVPLITALNDGGIETVASCCGHGHRPGNVSLADGRELLIAPDFETSREVERAFPVGSNGEPVAVGEVRASGLRPLVVTTPQTDREASVVDERGHVVHSGRGAPGVLTPPTETTTGAGA